MRYLITTNDNDPFFTDIFDPENHFNSESGMTVYDLMKMEYTTDGVNWLYIVIDHL